LTSLWEKHYYESESMDQPAPPPVPTPPITTVTTDQPKKGWFGNKKVILTILGILFLIGGVGVGVFLVQQQQEIRERAQVVESPSPSPTVTPTPSPSPTATPTSGGQCTEVKAYDTTWNLLTSTDLGKLEAGDTVRFTVLGTATQGTFDAARFTINGSLKPQVTTKKPNTNDFYYEYTLPAGVTSFEIKAELHHAGLDLWL